MRRSTVVIAFAAALAILVGGTSKADPVGEWGDAPEGSVAYPFLNPQVMGQFPTCQNVGPASYVYHGMLCWAHFAGLPPAYDFEGEGNSGQCPSFPPYDYDECYGVDAGLIFPDSYTIDAMLNVVTCPTAAGTPYLANVCSIARAGIEYDINVVNNMPVYGYLNAVFDWNQNGTWGETSVCPGPIQVSEHVIVNWPVPNGFSGPLSALAPTAFYTGPNGQYVWCRFTISEQPVSYPWDGSGTFEDGETEDYLLRLYDPTDVEPWSWGTIKGMYR
jgi:hypothetical protein